MCEGKEGGGVRPVLLPSNVTYCTGNAFKIISGRGVTLSNLTEYKYSRLSLSRLRLSQMTAYLEEKIWSLF